MSGGVSKLEFMVQDTEGAKLLREQHTTSRIERVFRVNLCVHHIPYSAPQTPFGEWVTLHGTADSVSRAKTYISALCHPEHSSELLSPSSNSGNSIIKLLFEPNSRLRDEIEREDCTSIQLSSDGTALNISGNKLDILSTERKLTSLMDTASNGRIHPEQQDFSQTCLPRTGEMFMAAGCLSRAAIVERPIDPQRQQRIEYFVGLSFDRSLVEETFRSHPETEDDEMLAVLMRRSASSSQRFRPLSIPRHRIEPIASPSSAVGGGGGSHDPSLLRPIVIDGSNVAMRHGNGKVFSCKGIILAVNWFLSRGHREITVFVPEWRKEAPKPANPITDQEILYQLEREKLLTFTPSRWVSDKVRGGQRRVVCYDDRFIVRLAEINEGVIVSNDQFRDLMDERKEWKELIDRRLLQFAFVNDIFMPPDDPLGRSGPSLEVLLQKDTRNSSFDKNAPPERPGVKVCPYLDRCTFGTKCKFYHPEREPRDPAVVVSPVNSNRSSATPSPSPDKKLHSAKSSLEDVRLLNQQSDVRTQPGGIDLQEVSDRMRMMELQNNRHPSPQKKTSESYNDPGCYYNAHGKLPPQRLDLSSAEQFVPPAMHPSPVPLSMPQSADSTASTPSGPFRNVTFPLLTLPQHHNETRLKVKTEEIRYIPPPSEPPISYLPRSGPMNTSHHSGGLDHQSSGLIEQGDPRYHPDRYQPQVDGGYPTVQCTVSDAHSFSQQQQQRSIHPPQHLYPNHTQHHPNAVQRKGYDMSHHQQYGNMSPHFHPTPPPPPSSNPQQHRTQHQNFVQPHQQLNPAYRPQTPTSQDLYYPPPPPHLSQTQEQPPSLLPRGGVNYPQPSSAVSYERCSMEQTNGYRSYTPSSHSSVSPPPGYAPTSNYHSSNHSSNHSQLSSCQARWLPTVSERRSEPVALSNQALYHKAVLLLPRCEERVQRVMAKWPHFNLEQIMEAVLASRD